MSEHSVFALSLLALDSIHHRIGSKELFHDLSLNLHTETRLGICGPNGSGKSTLLRILAQEIEPDQGRVVVARNTIIAYVPQHDEFLSSTSIADVIQKARTARLSTHSEHERNLDNEFQNILHEAGFADLTLDLSTLSGGWKKRLSIVYALLQKPDILLLDEPTNHLDVRGLHWLEKLLRKPPCPWVIVSHDRQVLENCCTELVEIAPYYEKGMFLAHGNYSVFCERREELFEQEAKQKATLANTLRREREWVSRSPKARSTKCGHRLQAAQKLEETFESMKQRQKREQAAVGFSKSERETKELVKGIHVSYAYGEQRIFEKTDFLIRNGECIGVLGLNGEGKSTLLKLIGGKIPPSSGSIKHADFLKVVYFDQLRDSLKSEETLRSAFGEGSDQVIYQGKSRHVVGWSKRFGFEAEDLEKSVRQLSGGEQARLLLAKLVVQEADLLLLDEPTNDLDISMLEALEQMLLEFTGACLLVTHDRYMLDTVCTSFLGFLSNNSLQKFESYAQWEAARNFSADFSQSSPAHQENEKTSAPIPPSINKIQHENRKLANDLEKQIKKAEKKLTELETQAAQPEIHSNLEKSHKIGKEMGELMAEIEKLYEEWGKYI